MQFFFNEETKAPNVDCPQMLNVFSLRGVEGGGWEAPRKNFPKAVWGSGLVNESRRDYGIEVKFGQINLRTYLLRLVYEIMAS